MVSLNAEDGIRQALLSILSPQFGERALNAAKENTIEVSAAHFLAFFDRYLKEVKP